MLSGSLDDHTLSGTICQANVWSNPRRWPSFQVPLGSLHVVPCILRGNLCRDMNGNLYPLIFSTVADISSTVTDIPAVADTFISIIIVG